METDEITANQFVNPTAGACAQAVASGIATYPELAAELRDIMARSRSAFIEASAEDKISSREALLARNAQPLVSVPKAPGGVKTGKKIKNVMRKNMNLLFDELLTDNKDAVYVGEDVEHGGCVADIASRLRIYSPPIS